MGGAGRPGRGGPGPAPEKAAELAGRCGGGQGLLRVPTRGATLTRNAKNSMKEPAGGGTLGPGPPAVTRLVVTSQEDNSAPSLPPHTLPAVRAGWGRSAHPRFGSLR